MPKTIKRKVRRHQLRRVSVQLPGIRLFAPIVGRDPRALYTFVLLDQGEPFSGPDLEHDVYLREV
jgi:hypothetical protein